LFGLHLSVTIS